jgi:transposase InsO family protein
VAHDDRTLRDLHSGKAREAGGPPGGCWPPAGAVRGLGAARLPRRRHLPLVAAVRAEAPGRRAGSAPATARAGRRASPVRLPAAARAAGAGGNAVNHQRVERLYHDEGLTARRRSRTRVTAADRTPALLPTAPNEQWSLDVVSDALAWGRRSRLLAIEVDTSLPGERVVRVLEQLATDGGAPNTIMLDNGPELTGRALGALDQRAYGRGVQLRIIQRGKSVQNAFAERFVGRLRDAGLNEHWFTSLAAAPHRRGVAPG